MTVEMTDEIENLRNLAEQLTNAGEQLDQEADEMEFSKATKDLLVPEILTDFSWEIDCGDSGCWYVTGKPVTARAKSLVEYTHSFRPMYDQPGCLMLKEKLKELGTPYNLGIAALSPPCLVWTIPFSKELLDWINTYPHLQVTNLLETVDNLRPTIKAKEEEYQRFKDLAHTLSQAHWSRKPVDNPVPLKSVNWKEVVSGKQKAPQLIEVWAGKWVTGGEWIYVCSTETEHRNVDFGWDRSEYSTPVAGCGKPVGLPFEKALKSLERMKYSALYRYLRNGIAELVCVAPKSENAAGS